MAKGSDPQYLLGDIAMLFLYERIIAGFKF